MSRSRYLTAGLTFFVFAQDHAAKAACDEDSGLFAFDTCCDPRPNWNSFVPNRGLFVMTDFEVGAGPSFLYSAYWWTSDESLAWYDMVDGSSLEIEAVVPEEFAYPHSPVFNGPYYKPKIQSVATFQENVDLSSKPMFLDYAVLLPCAYKDSTLGDSLTGSGDVTLTFGASACASELESNTLYYSLATLNTHMATKVDKLSFQPGRWAPDEPVKEALTSTCEEGLAAVDPDAAFSGGAASQCIFSCDPEWDDSGENGIGAYPVIGNGKHGRPFDLPYCGTWHFQSHPNEADIFSCKEFECNDGVDNDYDRSIDCDDSDCASDACCSDGAFGFVDVLPEHWYYEHVKNLVCQGTLDAPTSEDPYFDPLDGANRAEYLKIQLELAFPGFKFQAYTPTSSFPDVPSDAWYARYVGFAADNGIVEGYPDGTFQPDNTVSRAEAAEIAVNIGRVDTATDRYKELHQNYEALKADGQYPGAEYPDVPWFNDDPFDPFIDVDCASEWDEDIEDAYSGNCWFYHPVYALRDFDGAACGKETDGVVHYDPGAPVTRAETAKIACIVSGYCEPEPCAN